VERRTALGRLVVPDEVVAAVAARHAIATAPIACLVRPGAGGAAPAPLPVRHLARGVAVADGGGGVRLVIHAVARLGAQADDLRRAAAQTAEAVAASIGGDVVVDVEIRVVGVRVRRRDRSATGPRRRGPERGEAR
jgi:hypothetical protein